MMGFNNTLKLFSQLLRPYWALITVLLFTPFLLFSELPHTENRILNQLLQLGHYILFLMLSYLLCQFFERKTRQPQVIFVMIIGLILAFTSELLQPLVKRNFEVEDIISDILGCLSGIFFYVAVHSVTLSRRFSHRIFWGSLVAALGLTIVALQSLILHSLDQWHIQQYPSKIASFERSSEILRWENNRTESKLTKQSQLSLLKVDFLSAHYPTINLKHFNQNWSLYNKFSFRVLNPTLQTLQLTTKVYDQAHQANGYLFDDRFNHVIEVHPGWNQYEISLAEIKDAPKGRTMEMDKIASVSFFLVANKSKVTLFFDNLELTP